MNRRTQFPAVSSKPSATGASVLQRMGYNAYGMPNFMDASFGALSSSVYDWETLYNSYRWDAESGYYQVRNRYLHPTLGRWMSRDPIGYQGGLNLYAYCGNGPTNCVDPMGLGPNDFSLSGTLTVSPPSSGSPAYFLGNHGGEESSAGIIAMGASATHLASDAAQESGRFLMDGNLYKAGYYGNQYVASSDVAAAKLATSTTLDVVGHAAVITEVAMAGYELNESGYSNRGIATFGEDLGFIALGVMGGPLGAIAALLYVVAKNTGALKPVFDNYDNTPRTALPRVNTDIDRGPPLPQLVYPDSHENGPPAVATQPPSGSLVAGAAGSPGIYKGTPPGLTAGGSLASGAGLVEKDPCP